MFIRRITKFTVKSLFYEGEQIELIKGERNSI